VFETSTPTVAAEIAASSKFKMSAEESNARIALFESVDHK
jgi:hypothetical protein